MRKLELRDIRAIIDDYDVFFFDIWGVIVEGLSPYPGVIETINKVIERKKVFFVTNAPRNRLMLLNLIQSWGIKEVTLEMIISSGSVAVNLIEESYKWFGIELPIVYHLGVEGNDLIGHITSISITKNIEEANMLLLTVYREEHAALNLDEFNMLFERAIQNNTVNICANPDIGMANGKVYRYCAGYYAEKLKKLGGKIHYYVGKPYTVIYNEAFKKIPDVSKDRILMIGDTFHTDILGANKAHIDSALVLTGNAEEFHNHCIDMDEKLNLLHATASKWEAHPSFVIKLNW